MGKARFSASEIAAAELRNNPSADSRTIAKKLFKQHPRVWASIDAARSSVRYLRGRMGDAARKKAAVIIPRIEVPEPDDTGWRVHQLPTEIKKWLVISDIHVPYHSRKALQLALEFGRDQACDGVLINGDLIDFARISRFEDNPTLRHPLEELDLTNRVLDAIEKVGAKKIVMKCGNHDARLPKYLMQRCPEMFKKINEHFNINVLLKLRRRGISYVPDMHPIRHQELTILHGHEWGKGVTNPVNPARGAFLRAKDNVLSGHLHKTSNHSETTVRDVVISCSSTGCLCGLHPHYQPLTNWNHGFAILATGTKWSVHNYKIIGEKEVV